MISPFLFHASGEGTDTVTMLGLARLGNHCDSKLLSRQIICLVTICCAMTLVLAAIRLKIKRRDFELNVARAALSYQPQEQFASLDSS